MRSNFDMRIIFSVPPCESGAATNRRRRDAENVFCNPDARLAFPVQIGGFEFAVSCPDRRFLTNIGTIISV